MKKDKVYLYMHSRRKLGNGLEWVNQTISRNWAIESHAWTCLHPTLWTPSLRQGIDTFVLADRTSCSKLVGAAATASLVAAACASCLRRVMEIRAPLPLGHRSAGRYSVTHLSNAICSRKALCWETVTKTWWWRTDDRASYLLCDELQ